MSFANRFRSWLGGQQSYENLDQAEELWGDVPVALMSPDDRWWHAELEAATQGEPLSNPVLAQMSPLVEEPEPTPPPQLAVGSGLLSVAQAPTVPEAVVAPPVAPARGSLAPRPISAKLFASTPRPAPAPAPVPAAVAAAPRAATPAPRTPAHRRLKTDVGVPPPPAGKTEKPAPVVTAARAKAAPPPIPTAPTPRARVASTPPRIVAAPPRIVSAPPRAASEPGAEDWDALIARAKGVSTAPVAPPKPRAATPPAGVEDWDALIAQAKAAAGPPPKAAAAPVEDEWADLLRRAKSLQSA